MFKDFFLFELKYRLRRPATWLYAILIFALSFLIIATGSTPATEKVYHNSSIILAQWMIIMSLLGSLISSAIMGVPVYRDIEHRSQHFLFAYPVSEKGYLMGRYLGSLTVLMMVPVAGMFGAWLGTLLGPVFDWEEAGRYGPNIWSNYLQPFFLFSFINFLFTGTLFFALVATTKKAMAAYVGSMLFLVAYLISGIFMSDLETREIAAIFDPFGLNILGLETRYYTPSEINSLPIPMTSNIILNRAIWLGLSVFLLLLTVWKFSFKSFFIIRQKKSRKDESMAIPDVSILKRQALRNYGFGSQLRMTLGLARIEFLSVLRDRYFLAMMMGGITFLLLDGWYGSNVYGVPDLPSTFSMIEVKDFNYTIFVWVILLFYTGEVVHRNRSLNFAGIFDALPVPNWVNYVSKFIGISMVALMLCLLVVVSGITVQLLKGFTAIDLSMYLGDLLLIEFPEYLQVVMLAFFVHVMVNSKFAGHFIGIGIWVVMWGIRVFAEIDFNMYFYGNMPRYILSDMNGFGHFAESIFWFHIYWTAIGSILLMLGYLFWIRGTEESFGKRLRNVKQQLKPASIIGLLIAILIAGGAGGFIYYNTRILNKYASSKEQIKAAAKYEKMYKQYENIPQPKYTKVELFSDIFPYERRVVSRFNCQLKNKTAHSIDTLYITGSITGNRIEWAGKTLKPSFVSPEFFTQGAKIHFVKYALPQQLQSGEEASIVIYDTIEVTGFGNQDLNPRLTYNGSFLDLTPPQFGYSAQMELESDEDRKKHDLKPKNFDMPAFDDTLGRATFLFNSSADLVQFEAHVSTAADQIAIAPGYLQKEWTEGDRRYFHYKVDEPIDLFYSVVSARYAVAKDKVTLPDGRIIPIEIYHHPAHTYNLKRFIEGTKASLIYNSKNFSPYQFRQMRIVEFPRYMGFAQSFPNTVPYSESFAWLGDFSDPNDYDYAFYVTAHEMGHQWWGHQLSPNATRGSNLLSESLAEYSSIMVAEHAYGKENLRRFLKYDLDQYLRGRAMEEKKENVFIDCNRQYQWYQKGSLVLYALRDYIGEDTLNGALRNFMQQWGNRSEAPYPGSHDLYAFIEAVTPASLRYYLDETWHKITLYDNKVVDAQAKLVKGDLYEITLKLNSRKFYADSSGNERPGTFYNDQIDIGVFAEDAVSATGQKTTVPLYLKKHTVSKAGDQTITMLVKGKPIRAGIDPYNKLIDRISDDNVKPVNTVD